MSEKEEFFEDFGFGTGLEKRTLMAAAYPAIIRQTQKDGYTFYGGFLPGLQDSDVEDAESEDECVEILQDILDDKVEELVENERELPDVESDEKLIQKYPDSKIVYLDINVYVAKEDDECDHDCNGCHICHNEYDDDEDDEEDFVDDDDYEYEDEDDDLSSGETTSEDENYHKRTKYMEYRDDD